MITNPQATRILAFGDSLTWGYQPATKHQRFAANVRWPGHLQDLLGGDYEIIEEGLNSRGIAHGDARPGKEGRSALDYIIPCLDTHDPIDVVIVLLGTNELKYENGLTAEQVGAEMERLLQLILDRPSQCRAERPRLILISPPVIDDTTDYCRAGDKYKDAHAKSLKLGHVYATLAARLGIQSLNLAELLQTGADGIHIDAAGHAQLAAALAPLVINPSK